MSVTNEVPPTLDEMIFAISQINYNTLYRPLPPPPPATDCLSASLDNITEPLSTKTLTDASVIDDDIDVDEDDSENEEDNDKENQAMSVSLELNSSRWPCQKVKAPGSLAPKRSPMWRQPC